MASKGFDFASEDILSSNDDYMNQEASKTRKYTNPVSANSSGKDFCEGGMGGSALLHGYNQQEESLNQDVISAVEKSMKKYADNLLRFLEGISGRLSQLELYCYNLERSVGEMRSQLVRNHNETDSKLRSLEKHLQEVHRSVQILKEKQELAETQKELGKLQLAQKESLGVNHPQHNEEGAPSASDPKNADSMPEVQNQQLALALPHQVTQTPSLPSRSMDQHQPLEPSSQSPPQNIHVQIQPQAYYPSQNQLPNPQYLQVDPQYQRPQVQDLSRQASQPPQPQANLTQHLQSYPPYQQQWPQQFPRQVQQPPIRPQTTPVYLPYPPTQPANLSPEMFPGSMPMQLPPSGIHQSGVSHAEPMTYGYSEAARTTVQQQQQPPQHNMPQQRQPQTNQGSLRAHLSDGVYPGVGPLPSESPGQGYMMYDSEGGRALHPLPQHFPQDGYPPTHVSSLQNPQPTTSSGGHLVGHPSLPLPMMFSHRYSELIEKAVSMGYGRDHVASVIHRMEESGRPVDFNAVLDRLNMSSGGSQRGWSG